MNLIEQLGGYEAAKEKYQALSDSDMITIGPVEFSAKDYFEDELLEYRRQHNIFEALDWIMYKSKLYQIKYIHHPEKARITDGFQGRNVYDFPNGIRHATDAEIEAGKRLEVS